VSQFDLRGIGMTSQRTRDRLVQRLREHGISDERVLAVIGEVPRHIFIDEALATRAYEDTALPIGHGQTISQPFIVALMTKTLLNKPRERVLEIGTGSGYQAAVLSRIAREVVSVERYRTLAEAARARIETLGFDNIEIIVGDGMAGAPDRGAFDRIMVTAAADHVPQPLVDALVENGIMVLPLGPSSGAQYLVKLTKTHDGIAREELLPVRFVPLLPGKAQEL
jgi:protein-L-isoaspartate(D-aspartate) O-methyltransferase